ncbi:MAG TPA: hypothetical protein VLM40_12800, partial [Gemmata sp.]|nr:hypothetical protein [Gemmata sp.]
RAFFATRGDGDEAFTVRLTTDPALQVLYSMKWAPGETEDEGLISFLARRWVWDGSVWQVDPASVGLYTIPVHFDADGNAMAPEEEPTFVAWFGVFVFVGNPGAGPYPDMSSYCWSPDRSEIAYSTHPSGPTGGNQLRVLNLASGQTRILASPGMNPDWSPDGTKIAFSTYLSGVSRGSIDAIRPDGSGRTTIIPADRKSQYTHNDPIWSPTGSHLIYYRSIDTSSSDIYRATSDGRSPTNLTGDYHSDTFPSAWW